VLAEKFFLILETILSRRTANQELVVSKGPFVPIDNRSSLDEGRSARDSETGIGDPNDSDE
jgi:hypothetical protein